MDKGQHFLIPTEYKPREYWLYYNNSHVTEGRYIENDRRNKMSHAKRSSHKIVCPSIK